MDRRLPAKGHASVRLPEVNPGEGDPREVVSAAAEVVEDEVVAAGRRPVVPNVPADAKVTHTPRHDAGAQVPSESLPAHMLRVDEVGVREDATAQPDPTDAAGDVWVEG